MLEAWRCSIRLSGVHAATWGTLAQVWKLKWLLEKQIKALAKVQNLLALITGHPANWEEAWTDSLIRVLFTFLPPTENIFNLLDLFQTSLLGKKAPCWNFIKICQWHTSYISRAGSLNIYTKWQSPLKAQSSLEQRSDYSPQRGCQQDLRGTAAYGKSSGPFSASIHSYVKQGNTLLLVHLTLWTLNEVITGEMVL